MYPSAMLPAIKDEIEPMPMGQPATITIDEERLSLDLAERRSGVAPPQQGAGSGSFNKRGIYTAMGTLALMQDSNTRTDLNVTDMRYAHTRLGRLLCDMYSEFGIGERDLYFGRRGRILEDALQLYKNKLLALPISAATASINREVEKQNDLALANVQRMHFQNIMAMMGQLSNPGAPPEAKKYMADAMEASNILMRMIYRHFAMDEVERLAPDVPKPQAQPPQGAPGQQPGPPGQQAPTQPQAPGQGAPGPQGGLALPTGAQGMLQ